MEHWTRPIEQRALARLNSEQVIWLTTVSASGAPQPRPVWFVWDGARIVIYSEPTARKVAHVAANPRVSLNFNCDAGGDDVQVILGRASLAADGPAPRDNADYLAKYAEAIPAIGQTIASFTERFSAVIVVEPTRVRGLDPLP